MRAWTVLLVLLLAGCASPDAPTQQDRITPSTPTVEAATPEDGASEERMPITMERFVLAAGGRLVVLDPTELPVEKVPEPLRATAFYESFASPLKLMVWTSEPFQSAWESTDEIEISLSFAARAPAVSPNPRTAGFPPVGAWLGTPERYAFFLLAQDAPDTLEAETVYTVTMRAPMPRGGFFVREGEQLALHTFLSYQAADGSAVDYVVGGPDPAGLALPHQHFALQAPIATVLLDERGEIAPNPGPTGDMQQTPVSIPFTVPTDALFVVIEIDGTPKAGTRLDMDVSARTPSGEVVVGASGPHQREVVVMGPGNLAQAGRELLAHVVNAANPSGATYALKVTAYSPERVDED
jgi:hypothetical protein